VPPRKVDDEVGRIFLHCRIGLYTFNNTRHTEFWARVSHRASLLLGHVRHAMTSIQPHTKDGGGGIEMTNLVTAELETSTSTPTRESTLSRDGSGSGEKERGRVSIWRKVYTVLAWTPPNCRWDPKKPPQFSMGMNVLFAFAGACE
jgi:hypothetical protein